MILSIYCPFQPLRMRDAQWQHLPTCLRKVKAAKHKTLYLQNRVFALQRPPLVARTCGTFGAATAWNISFTSPTLDDASSHKAKWRVTNCFARDVQGQVFDHCDVHFHPLLPFCVAGVRYLVTLCWVWGLSFFCPCTTYT